MGTNNGPNGDPVQGTAGNVKLLARLGVRSSRSGHRRPGSRCRPDSALLASARPVSRKRSAGCRRRRRADQSAARDVEIVFVQAALILCSIQCVTGIDAQTLQVVLEGLCEAGARAGIEKLDGRAARSAVSAGAAVPLASGLAQEFVRAAQQLPVLPGSVGDRRGEHGFSKTEVGSLPRKGSSSVSSSGEGLPTAFMSLFSKNDAVRLNRPNMMLAFVHSKSKARPIAPNARILEGFAAC